jgi:hypothetical protein
MGYDPHAIEFDRIAPTWVNLPVISQSTFVVTPTVGEVGSLLTYTLYVRNTGVADGVVTATNPLSDVLLLQSNSIQASGGVTQTNGDVITWAVPVAVGDTATMTYTAIISDIPPEFVIRNQADLDDGLGNTLPLEARVSLKALPVYLPIVLK